MLVYDAISPAPRCLRMFLLEKGLHLPAVAVDVMRGENREAAYLALNPAGQTPALRLDDGTTLAEAVAIAEYLEELHPAPALIGSTPEERALTRQWWRRVELNVTEFIHNAFHYAEGLPRFAPRIPVAPEAAAGLKRIAQDRLAWLDGLFGTGPWLCGERFSAADAYLFTIVGWSAFTKVDLSTFPKLRAFMDRVGARPKVREAMQAEGMKIAA